MLGVLGRALRTHGKPDIMYLDNGSTYRGEVLRTAQSARGWRMHLQLRLALSSAVGFDRGANVPAPGPTSAAQVCGATPDVPRCRKAPDPRNGPIQGDTCIRIQPSEPCRTL